ncbi:MAG TPA: hypothetical protein VGE66_13205 [Chitinophagaceae bacterium]
MHKLLLFALFAAGFTSCAPARFVKPLDEGRHAAALSLGGPLIKFGETTIPMPLVSAVYGYGFDSTFTGFGGLNLTSAFYGNVQLDLGVTKKLLSQKGAVPAVSVTPVANIIYRNKDAKKLYPQLDIHAYWEVNRARNLIYAGFSNWFELGGEKAHDKEQEHRWLFTPQVGHQFVRPKWDITIEAKIIAPHISYESNVVEYQSPLGKSGAFGIYFGYTRKF